MDTNTQVEANTTYSSMHLKQRKACRIYFKHDLQIANFLLGRFLLYSLISNNSTFLFF